ncbi:dihydrofolate reductase family protein [Fodinicola acaciae]|uniref:dihydrofolate reductase family protein n=1 Tax=Fodinicola acaciae TaxID=2681555 RepID=UPI0013D6ACEE|nr:dihydrofolate reductase family protein [Fodinicola acaciae]
MRKLTVMAFLSLDGVVQGPGGSDEDRDGGFRHGGWAVPHIDEQHIKDVGEFANSASALLVGRRTYDIFAATWPLAAADDPIGAKMNGVRKYVASRTLSSVSWQNSTLLTGDVHTAVERLKSSDGGDIQVHGSGAMIQTLLDLVDEFRLYVFPVLVGSGKRLFGNGTVPAGLRLVEATTSKTGVVAATYTRAGELTYGAMGPETGNW